MSKQFRLETKGGNFVLLNQTKTADWVRKYYDTKPHNTNAHNGLHTLKTLNVGGAIYVGSADIHRIK